MLKKIAVSLSILCFSSFGALNIAQAAPGTHVHFAAFFSNGTQANFKFPATVVGDDIEKPMVEKGAEMMLFAHSVSIHDGDVLNLQNDTLREMSDGTFHDFGLNCQITMRTESKWTVSGMCQTFLTGEAQNNQIILPVSIPKQLVWYKVFEDQDQGMAGYFMKEKGQDFSE